MHGSLFGPKKERLFRTTNESSENTMPAPTKYHEAVAATKKQVILQAMDQTKGNYTEAAKLLGVHPNYLHRLIRNLDLRDHLKS